MVTPISTAARAAILLAMAGGMIACNESPQGGNPVESGPQLARVQFVMAQDGSSSTTAPAPATAMADEGRLTTGDISSLMVTVTGVQFLRADAAGDADSGWVSVTLDEPATLDLLALPTADESPLVFASGTVAVGSYKQVRLFVNDAQVTFATDLTVGQATFTADTEYPVTVPSADQSGIKTDAAFDIVADSEGAVADIPLFFDPSATFLNATITGSGNIMLAPVINANAGGS